MYYVIHENIKLGKSIFDVIDAKICFKGLTPGVKPIKLFLA